MTTLIQQIRAADQRIAKTEAVLRIQREEQQRLMDSRVDCDHKFAAPFKGFEHEGGNCTKCGINAIYADTLSWQKRTQRAKS